MLLLVPPKYFSNPLILFYSMYGLCVLNISHQKHSKAPKLVFQTLVLTPSPAREIFLEYRCDLAAPWLNPLMAPCHLERQSRLLINTLKVSHASFRTSLITPPHPTPHAGLVTLKCQNSLCTSSWFSFPKAIPLLQYSSPLTGHMHILQNPVLASSLWKGFWALPWEG